MPEQNNPQLKEILTTAEHGVMASTQTTKAVKELELPLEAIAKNTAPKDVQKVEIIGAEIITIRGEKGEKGDQGETGKGEKGDTGAAFQFKDFTPEQIADLKGEKGEIGPVSTVPGPQGPASTVPGPQGPEGAASTVPGPRGPQGPAGSPDTGEQIVEKLHGLEGDNRLSYDDLKNLPNLDTFRKGNSSKSYATSDLTDVSMQGIIAGQLLQWDGAKFIPYTPSSSGTNQTFGEIIGTVGSASFTLAHATVVAGTVRIYRGGAYQQVGAGNDYTIAGVNGTLSMVLQQGEVLLADYNWL